MIKCRNGKWISGCQDLEVEGGTRYDFKRATAGIHVMMKLLCILIISMSVFWIIHRTTVLQDVTTGRD